MSGQCLDRRIPDRAVLEREVAAWQEERNGLGGRVDWRFVVEDARIKLKRLYPVHPDGAVPEAGSYRGTVDIAVGAATSHTRSPALENPGERS